MSTTGGSAWTQIDDKMDDGFTLAGGSLYVGGGWEHDGDVNTLFVPAVFKTTDDGTTWERWALHTNPGYIYSIAVHPTNSSIVLAAGQRYNASNVFKSALFKTTNGGSDWAEITTTISNDDRINQVCYDPFNSERVFAATYGGVYRSTNGGSSWQSPSKSLNAVCVLADPNIKNRLFAGGYGGVFVTTNGGNSWNPMNDGLTCLNVNCMDLDKQEHVLYVGTEGGTYRYQLATAVEDETPEVLPSEFVLFQNHPNPFNGETEISYQVNRPGEYQLSVIDVQGRILCEFAPGNQGVGIKRIVWDGRDDSGQIAASGVYFIQLQSRTSRAVRKMIFQK